MTTTTTSRSTLQLCSFRLGGRLFGVDIMDVKEINADIRITPIHHAPASVRGYMNIRGLVHLVVDLNTLFGFDVKPVDAESKVIIFKPSAGEAFGVLVDRIADVIAVDRASIEDRREKRAGKDGEQSDRRKADAGLTVGVCKLEKDLMVVLDAGGILRLVEKSSTQTNVQRI